MAIPKAHYALAVLVVLFVVSSSQKVCNPECKAKEPFNCDNTGTFNRTGFAKNFTFGAATSAYQIEGAAHRALNGWDYYTHRYPERVPDRSSGDLACNSYDLYKDDVQLLKRMNVKAYRLSIAWSRVLPKGRLIGGVDESGITYYNNLINELKANGIEPYVTIFHWDVPQTLEDEYGGFLSKRIVEDYTNYAELLFQRFGDRVKFWITLNQPYSFATKGYGDGSYPPGRCSNRTTCEFGGDSATEPYIVAHHQLLAHATTVSLYRQRYQMDLNPVCVVPGKWIFLDDGRWKFEIKAGIMAHTLFVSRSISYDDLRSQIEAKFKVNGSITKLTLSFWSPGVTTLVPPEYIPPIHISSDSDVVHFQNIFSNQKDINIVADFEEESKNFEDELDLSQETQKMLSLLEQVEAEYNEKKRKTVDLVDDAKRICYDIVPVESGEEGVSRSQYVVEDGADMFEDIEKNEHVEHIGDGNSEPEDADENSMFDALATVVDRENVVAENVVSVVEGRGEPYSQNNEYVANSCDSTDQQSCDHGTSSDLDWCTDNTLNTVTSLSVVNNYDSSGVSSGPINDVHRVVEPIGFNLGIPGVDVERIEGTDPHGQIREIRLEEIDASDPVFVDPPPVVEDLLPADLEEIFFVGREYDNKSKFNLSLALYALERCFCYRITKADPSRTIANCSDPDCRWRVYAGPSKDGIKYIIRTLVSEHTCGVQYRSRFHEKATPKVLGELIKHHYIDGRKGPRACEIPDMLLHSHGLNIKYFKAWNVREIALAGVTGGEENNYKLLPTYLKLLQKYNPGTITEMMKSVNSNGDTRFKYMFLAFGASVYGYAFVRKVIVVDGTQLKGKYKGCLLTASCQDGNMQIFPLAFGVVDSENDKSWTWFLENLGKFVEDDDELVLISDRHSSIRYAVSRVFPNAHHCCCIIHLCRNVKLKFKCEGLASVVARAARAFTRTEFERWWGEIERRSAGCVSYLREAGFPQWSRYHCTGNRYNLMTSNIAESVNAAVKKSVDYPIITMIEYARTLLMSWFYRRRLLSKSSQQVCTPQIESLLIHNVEKGRHCFVKPASSTVFSVSETDGRVHIVDLEHKTCTCMVFNCFKIPCPHALAACLSSEGNIYDLVDKYYHKDVWASVYEKAIMPVPSIDENGNEVYQDLQPPATKRPPGRPPKARIPSAGETNYNGPYRSPRCGRCGLTGHNKSTCKNPLP